MPVVLLLIALSMGPAVALSTADHHAVLAGNTEFYHAFRENDMPAMETVWGQVEPIAVEHPSSWREEGREALLANWVAILRAAQAIIPIRLVLDVTSRR